MYISFLCVVLDLDDQEESALIDLMCCACTQAATGVAPPGRNPSKKVPFHFVFFLKKFDIVSN